MLLVLIKIMQTIDCLKIFLNIGHIFKFMSLFITIFNISGVLVGIWCTPKTDFFHLYVY